MKFLPILLLAGVTAVASPIVTQVQLTNAGSPGVIASSVTINGKTDNNVYIGPYTMLINGQNVPALCIDFADTSYLNTSFNADVTTVGSSDLSNTYWPSYGIEYKEEAYIFSQILKPGADRTGLQLAAWKITSYGITNTSYAQTYGDDAYVDAALANYSGFNYSNFYIISDTQQHGEQEFIISATPEPGSVLLLGSGLLASAAMLAYKRRKAVTAPSAVQK
jgi:hypothetical protein